MKASELLTPDFPFLAPEDSISRAKKLFKDNQVNHLAVVASNQIEGILSSEVMLEDINLKGTINDLRDDFVRAQVLKDQHGLDIFEVVSKLELSSVPVSDEENHYIGTITTQDLLYNLSSLYSFRHIGGIIVLSIGIRDYNLTEISRIVETNNAKIILMYMDMDESNSNIKITLKVDTLDISHIVATFERFKYTIDFQQPNIQSRDEMQERYALLMKMLDI